VTVRRPERWVPWVPLAGGPRRLLGHTGPLVVGVMGNADPAVIREWIGEA